jgi:hypothetical protein
MGEVRGREESLGLKAGQLFACCRYTVRVQSFYLFVIQPQYGAEDFFRMLTDEGGRRPVHRSFGVLESQKVFRI